MHCRISGAKIKLYSRVTAVPVENAAFSLIFIVPLVVPQQNRMIGPASNHVSPALPAVILLLRCLCDTMEPWGTTKPCAIPDEESMTSPATNSTATASLRPQPGEYAPYYDSYISLVPGNVQGNDILIALEDQRRQMLLLLSGRTEADGDLRYAPGKWSLREVLGHINDTERIMSYRALRIARGDQTPLEGFEQDDYVRNGAFARRPLAGLIEDYIAVRGATHLALSQSRGCRLDAPRRGQQERSDGARPGLHHRRARTASSENYRGEVSEIEFCNLVIG